MRTIDLPIPGDAPRLYDCDPASVASNLDYPEMMVLSEAFIHWALKDEDIEPEERTTYVQLGCDFEALAGWVGPEWRAPYPIFPPTVLKTLAGKLLRAGGPDRPLSRMFHTSEWKW